MLLKLLMSPLMSPQGLALDRWLVRHTGHSLLNRVFARQAGFTPRPALLLETTGRKSGETRAAALPYFEIDNKLLVAGSRGGMPTDPNWVSNLRIEPRCQVTINRRRHMASARIADGDEHDRLWQQLVAIVPTYATYQANTSRRIPVVILEIDG